VEAWDMTFIVVIIGKNLGNRDCDWARNPSGILVLNKRSYR